jgi:hypothetical protein
MTPTWNCSDAKIHDVKEIAGIIATAASQDIHQAVLGTGDWLKSQQGLELARDVRRAGNSGSGLVYREQRADDISSQPDFAVSATTDQAQRIMIGNLGSLKGNRTARHRALTVGLEAIFLPHGGKEGAEEVLDTMETG